MSFIKKPVPEPSGALLPGYANKELGTATGTGAALHKVQKGGTAVRKQPSARAPRKKPETIIYEKLWELHLCACCGRLPRHPVLVKSCSCVFCPDCLGTLRRAHETLIAALSDSNIETSCPGCPLEDSQDEENTWHLHCPACSQVVRRSHYTSKVTDRIVDMLSVQPQPSHSTPPQVCRQQHDTICHRLAQELGGVPEFVAGNYRLDVWAEQAQPAAIVEVKDARQWHHGLGQLLVYRPAVWEAGFLPRALDPSLRLHLFGADWKAGVREMAPSVCAQLGVVVTWE